MIDPIKTSRSVAALIGGPRPTVPVAAGPRGEPHVLGAASPSLSSEIRNLASAPPPFDAPRVDSIRAAIAEGRYPVDPVRIAAAMLVQESGV